MQTGSRQGEIGELGKQDLTADSQVAPGKWVIIIIIIIIVIIIGNDWDRKDGARAEQPAPDEQNGAVSRRHDRVGTETLTSLLWCLLLNPPFSVL